MDSSIKWGVVGGPGRGNPGPIAAGVSTPIETLQLLSLVVLLLGLPVSFAHSTVLSSAIYYGCAVSISGDCYSNSQGIPPPGPLLNQGFSGSSFWAENLTFAVAPEPSLSAVSGETGSKVQVAADGYIEYDFTVEGPVGSDVLVDVAFSGSVTAGISEFSTAELFNGITQANASVQWDSSSVSTPAAASYTCTAAYSTYVPPDNYCDTFSGVLSETIQVGSLNEIFISVSAESGGAVTSESSPLTAGASALMDPYIYVDPSFPDAGLYTIVTSDGIGNLPNNVSGAVPEPGSLALFGGALFGLAGARRRRRA